MEKAIYRLFKYIEYLGLSNREFERKISVSNNYLKSTTLRNGDIGETVFKNIYKSCVDLNLIWLITGEGEMLVKKEDIGEIESMKRDIELLKKWILTNKAPEKG